MSISWLFISSFILLLWNKHIEDVGFWLFQYRNLSVLWVSSAATLDNLDALNDKTVEIRI